MKSLVMAFKSRQGKTALIGMVIGIVVASVGGFIFEDNVVMTDFIVLAGAIFSMVGAEQFCKLIIHFREELGEE
mgnify:CR=1 FL=1